VWCLALVLEQSGVGDRPAEGGEDGAFVLGDGALGQAHYPGDFVLGVALEQHLDDLAIAVRQGVDDLHDDFHLCVLDVDRLFFEQHFFRAGDFCAR